MLGIRMSRCAWMSCSFARPTSDELMKMCISHGTFSMRKMVLARIIKQEDLSTTWEIAIRHNLHAEVAEMRLYENTRRDMCEDDVYNILRLCTEFGRFQIMKKFVRSHPVACVPFLRDDDHILSTACWFTADFKISMGHAAAGNLPEHGRMSCGRTVKYHDHHAKQTAFFFLFTHDEQAAWFS